jgi:hypothetical protein
MFLGRKMKIKSDFITNSSSTAYVAYIPNEATFEKLDLVININRVIDNVKNEYGDEEEEKEIDRDYIKKYSISLKKTDIHIRKILIFRLFINYFKSVI